MKNKPDKYKEIIPCMDFIDPLVPIVHKKRLRKKEIKKILLIIEKGKKLRSEAYKNGQISEAIAHQKEDLNAYKEGLKRALEVLPLEEDYNITKHYGFTTKNKWRAMGYNNYREEAIKNIEKEIK